jgi:hypothetical protein
MDDSSVGTAKLATVLKQQAYILTYTRRDPLVPTRAPEAVAAAAAAPAKQPKSQGKISRSLAVAVEAVVVKPPHTPKRERASASVLDTVASAAADSDGEDDAKPVAAAVVAVAAVSTTPAMPSAPMSPAIPTDLGNGLRDAENILTMQFASDPGWRVDCKVNLMSVDWSEAASVADSDDVAVDDAAAEGEPADERYTDDGTSSEDESSSDDEDEDEEAEVSTLIDAVAVQPPLHVEKGKKRVAQVLAWDHTMTADDKGAGTPFQWDGKRRKKDDVLDFLKSDRTIGHQVHSWTGDTNTVDAVNAEQEVSPTTRPRMHTHTLTLSHHATAWLLLSRHVHF